MPVSANIFRKLSSVGGFGGRRGVSSGPKTHPVDSSEASGKGPEMTRCISEDLPESCGQQSGGCRKKFKPSNSLERGERPPGDAMTGEPMELVDGNEELFGEKREIGEMDSPGASIICEPGGENGAPDGRNVESDEENVEPDGEPDSENVEPDSENVEPDSENVEPDSDNVEPDGENVELDGENVEPDGEYVEPDKENVEPDKENVEPDKENVEPDKENVEPDGENVEPDGENVEPDGENVEPGGENVEPGGENGEPDAINGGPNCGSIYQNGRESTSDEEKLSTGKCAQQSNNCGPCISAEGSVEEEDYSSSLFSASAQFQREEYPSPDSISCTSPNECSCSPDSSSCSTAASFCLHKESFKTVMDELVAANSARGPRCYNPIYKRATATNGATVALKNGPRFENLTDPPLRTFTDDQLNEEIEKSPKSRLSNRVGVLLPSQSMRVFLLREKQEQMHKQTLCEQMDTTDEMDTDHQR